MITLLATEAVSIIDKNAALAGYCRVFVLAVLALLLMGLAFVSGMDCGMSQMGGVHKAHKSVEVAIFIFIAVAAITILIALVMFILICWKTL